MLLVDADRVQKTTQAGARLLYLQKNVIFDTKFSQVYGCQNDWFNKVIAKIERVQFRGTQCT